MLFRYYNLIHVRFFGFFFLEHNITMMTLILLSLLPPFVQLLLLKHHGLIKKFIILIFLPLHFFESGLRLIKYLLLRFELFISFLVLFLDCIHDLLVDLFLLVTKSQRPLTLNVRFNIHLKSGQLQFDVFSLSVKSGDLLFSSGNFKFD